MQNFPCGQASGPQTFLINVASLVSEYECPEEHVDSSKLKIVIFFIKMSSSYFSTKTKKWCTTGNQVTAITRNVCIDHQPSTINQAAHLY
jgi:hypothetical protein